MAASQDIGGYDVTDGASILNEAGLSIDDMRTVELGPGDVALWTPFTVHGGGINTTESEERRFYINGYAKACNCDRGHLVFKVELFCLNVYINNLCLGRRATATRRASANSNRGLCSKGALLHVGREALSHPGLMKTSLPLR